MICCITDLRDKEIINTFDGCRLGHVCDVEIDTCDGRVTALIVFGASKLFGLLGRDEDIRICWDEIEVIGDEIILVCIKRDRDHHRKKKERIIESILR
ncbi:MAG: YlmC/YmxH family sporulation protein [Oscillospiraceae bacterium]|nr:YlmC/YmxH family sporulation protein [Oscillospiraceae bacterium]